MAISSPADDAERFSEALVSEIKAEMGRRDLTTAGLARLIGESKQYVSSRLGAGNPHTGKRVTLTVPDLFVIAEVLELSVHDLIATARAAAGLDEASAAG